jgi:hypothetical protein
MTGIPDIATLADKQAITEVVRTYCRAVDRLDIPLGQSIFHEDGHADYGPFYTGPGKGVIEAICESHHHLTSHSHQVTNILIEVDGDRAGSEAYVFGTMRSENEGKVMQIGAAISTSGKSATTAGASSSARSCSSTTRFAK